MTDEADSGRAQDQGRRHRRKGSPTAATATLLAQYQSAMRDELRALLGDLAGREAPPSLDLVEAPARIRPPLKERASMWDLAIKLGRELGTEVDASPVADPDRPAPARSRRAKRVDYG